jgi:hypothetical protein
MRRRKEKRQVKNNSPDSQEPTFHFRLRPTGEARGRTELICGFNLAVKVQLSKTQGFCDKLLPELC